MNRSGGEAFARLAQQLNRARMQASGGGPGKGGAGGGNFNMPGGAKGAATGGGLLAVLAVGGLALNYSIFNGECPNRYDRVWGRKWLMGLVDGGHRAIKYSRLQGVRSDIYPEGTHLVVCTGLAPPCPAADRVDTLVRVPDHI